MTTRLAAFMLAGTALAGAALVTACSTSTATSPTDTGPTSRPGCAAVVASEMQTVVDTYGVFEAESEQTAVDGGPAGLAEFVMVNRRAVLDAGLGLASAIDLCPDAGSAQEMALVQQIAATAIAYGQSLSDTGDALDACPASDFDCWEAAYDTTDPAASSKRAALRAAIFSAADQ